METCQSAHHDQVKVLHNVTLRLHSQSFDCCTGRNNAVHLWWLKFLISCMWNRYILFYGAWKLLLKFKGLLPFKWLLFWVYIPTLLSKLLCVYSSTVSLDCRHAITVQGDCILQCDRCGISENPPVWCLTQNQKKKVYIRVPLLHSVQGPEPGLELDRTMGERVSLTVSSITSGGTCKVEISWSYGGAEMESSKCETTCQDPPKAPFIMSVAVHLQTDIMILNNKKKV